MGRKESNKFPDHVDILFQEDLHVTETNNVLKVHTDKPHLVSMGSGRLSTAVTILPLKHGELI